MALSRPRQPEQPLATERAESARPMSWPGWRRVLQVLGRAADGTVVRRAGVMGVVRRGGEVRPGDPVTVVLPEQPHRPLDRV